MIDYNIIGACAIPNLHFEVTDPAQLNALELNSYSCATFI